MEFINKMEKYSKGVLGLILFVAFILRVVGIRYGLPYHFRPDEEMIVLKAIDFGRLNNFNPYDFIHPSLPYYIAYFIDWIYEVIIHFTSGISSNIFWTDYARTHQEEFYLIARWINVILGSLSVWIAWKIIKEKYSTGFATLGALLLSVTFLHVRESHFAMTDVACGFWMLCAYWFALRIQKDGKLKDYLLAGLFTAFACSTKYNGGLIILPVLYSHYLFSKRINNKEERAKLSKYLLMFIGMLTICFFITNPYILHNIKQFISDLANQSRHLKEGHYGVKMGIGWWYHFKFTLPNGIGWELFIVSLLGIVFGLKRHKNQDKLLLSIIFPYYFYLGFGYTVFVRYMIPLVPFLIIAGVTGIFHIRGYIQKKLPKHANVVMAIILILAILPTLLNSLRFDYLLRQVDTRIESMKWIQEKLPQGAKIGLCGMYGHPPLPYRGKQEVYAYGGYRNDLLGFDEPYIKLMIENKGLQYLEVDYHPIIYSLPIRKSGDYEPQNYLMEFSPKHGNSSKIPGDDFDKIDAFYIPYRHLWSYERPGPLIKIYSLE